MDMPLVLVMENVFYYSLKCNPFTGYEERLYCGLKRVDSSPQWSKFNAVNVIGIELRD
ncbi:hypothetical protein [Peribacillus butanolivorans]|uniref:hypothetical protein n=1 Tax=Peribacillus butanolivorans TaxID=421767 RepID=UPI00366C3857